MNPTSSQLKLGKHADAESGTEKLTSGRLQEYVSVAFTTFPLTAPALVPHVDVEGVNTGVGLAGP